MTSSAASHREEELFRQQDVLARFGELAIRSPDLDDILQEACRLVREALGTDLAKVMELQADGTTLLVKAGVGWQPGIVGQVKVEATAQSSEGHALRTGVPVISSDIESENRFEYADFIKEAGVKALVNVIILGPEDHAPYGILQVDSRQPRDFTDNDTKFLRGYANLIAAAVNRLHVAEELRQKTARLREVKERQEVALETGLIGFFVWNVTTNIITGDRRFADFYGFAPEQAATGIPLEDLVALVHIDDRPALMANVEAALVSRSDYTKQFRLARPDRSARWLLVRGRFYDRGGAFPLFYNGTVVDVTASKTAEAALRESEQRFQQFGAASSDALWIRDADSQRFEYVSPAFETIYGVARAEIVGGDDLRKWANRIVPQDRRRALHDLDRVRAGEKVTLEFRIERASDGEVRWIRDTVFPLFNSAGRVQRVGGIAQDVTEERATTDRMQVLVAELQHRTRNLMGVVRSTMEATLRSSATLQDFTTKYRDRIAALSRVQGVLSRLWPGDRITFDKLLEDELSAMGALERVTLKGPKGIALRSNTVQILAMALHELATNAVKYGALHQSDGRLAVTWQVRPAGPDRKSWLQVDWHESGVSMPPPDEVPQGTGQGRQLIERALPYQLGAETTYVMGPDGIRCFIALPLSPWPEVNYDGKFLPGS